MTAADDIVVTFSEDWEDEPTRPIPAVTAAELLEEMAAKDAPEYVHYQGNRFATKRSEKPTMEVCVTCLDDRAKCACVKGKRK